MGVFNAFIAYKFIKILSTPWEKTDAYKLGIIDEKGKILKKRKRLETTSERKAYTIFHQLIWNLKKILEKVPIFKSRLATFTAALYLIKEHTDPTGTLIEDAFFDYLKENGYDVDSMLINESFENREMTIKRGLYVMEGTKFFIEEEIKAFDELYGITLFKINFLGEERIITTEDIKLYEDAPVNAAGGGENIAGLDGKPPVSKKNQTVHRRRAVGITGGTKESVEVEEGPRLKALLKKTKMDKFSRSERKRKKDKTKKIRKYNRMVGIPLSSSYDAELDESVEESTSFAGARVFKVTPEEYCNCLQGRRKHERWKRKLNMDSIDNVGIQKYAHRNPGKSIIVQNEKTGEMSYLIR